MKPSPHAPRLWATTGLATALTLCVSDADADDSPTVRALENDIEVLVSAQEDTGWTVDRYEFESVMGEAVYSVCHVDAQARAQTLARLERRISELGGPLEDAYEKSGDIDDHKDLLDATRRRDLLRIAVERADDECSVWMKPDPQFRGIQSDADRFTLHLEGGGLLEARTSTVRGNVGAGGSARVLVGRGFGHHYTLLLGGEFGGTALFRKTDLGTDFPISFMVATPIVLRHRFITWHHDLEVAPLFHFTDDERKLSYGARVGVLLGIARPRIRNITPWAGVGGGLEFIFKNEHRPAFGAIRGGLRIGFDWDY